ncbi:MAG TPA: ATP-binding protein [Holophagaceae bacterium]
MALLSLQPPPARSDALGPAMGALGGARGRVARSVLVGTWALVALAHLALARERRELDWPLGYLLMEVLATASLGYRAWLCRSESCRAWIFLALSTGLEVPNLLLLYLGIHGHIGAWAQEGASLLSLGTGIFVLVGVLSFPKGQETEALFRRRVLDALIFAASVLFLLWVMGVHGSLRKAAEGLELRVFAAYLNAALLGGGVVFAISYHPARIRGPLGWLAASVLAWLAGLSWWTLSGLAPTQGEGGWLAVVGGIPLFQGLAAWSPRPVVTSEPAAGMGTRLSRMLPYVPVVVALGVLAVILPGAPLDVMRGAFGIFLVLVALLLLRQFQAIQDLQVARRTLEDRVQQRTRALEQAQDTLLRTERMNTLALMGAGLAHDLNNLLSAMKSSAELAAMNLEEGTRPEPRDLLRIVSTADRAATLTRRLMGFVRREAEEMEPTDLGGEVRNMEATLRLLLPRPVELRIQVAPEEPLVVKSSRLRLEQMLVNLAANAADAMPEGGVLAIHAGSAGTDTGLALLEVSDTGTGMAPEVLERIFDPFFTTKPPGRGTGLGLPSLKAMVEEAEGRIEVESQPGRGTRFRILLPRMI